MLQSISWKEFITTSSVLLIVYYIFIGYLYYKSEILRMFGIEILKGNSLHPVTLKEFRQVLQPENNEDYLPKTVTSSSTVITVFKDEISSYLHSSAEALVTKKEIVEALQTIISKYQVSITDDSNYNLRQFILSEAAKTHPGILTEEDVHNVFR
jgi:hypothetical protein